MLGIGTSLHVSLVRRRPHIRLAYWHDCQTLGVDRKTSEENFIRVENLSLFLSHFLNGTQDLVIMQQNHSLPLIEFTEIYKISSEKFASTEKKIEKSYCDLFD